VPTRDHSDFRHRAAIVRRADSNPACDEDVRKLVHDALSLALGVPPATETNPLRKTIKAGMRVFVLVNHVTHRRAGESDLEFQSKVTSSAVVSHLAFMAAEATGSTALVTIGNAPLQSCDYEQLMKDVGLRDQLELREISGVSIADLRGVVSKWSRFGRLLDLQRRAPELGVTVELGPSSLLEELYGGVHDPQFRVSDYRARDCAKYHSKGKHSYVVHKSLLEADVIISVPTLKTHQKVGLTAVVKGCVGAIYLKQCLAHHRLGGASAGGDEFSPDGVVRRLISRLSDRASNFIDSAPSGILAVAAKLLYRAARISSSAAMGGAWEGNDTAWRMSLDIARVLRFARPDGTLADEPQRHHVAVVDGIVAGEGEGPLRPTPRIENLIIAATDPLSADVLACLAMGWNPMAIPTLRHAPRLSNYPLTECQSLNDIGLLIGESVTTLDHVRPLTEHPFTPPKLWTKDALIHRRCEQ
jgi:uncharacterized protein (DUF362 family)